MDKEAIIEIRVIPGSSKREINYTEEGGFRVYLNTPPVDGKANADCIKLMAKELKIAKGKVSILKGELNRNKRLRIQGFTTEELIERFR